MNKTKFRVIFNRTLLRWVVTSELAKTADKSSPVGDGEAVKSAVHFGSVLTLSSLSFSLFCALGFVSLVVPQVALANLEIRADKTAPVNQQPIILSTANGIPQVNIQTPNSKGLSHNKYAQFDVAEKGAILNNSRTTVQTQQGGLVTGNPYLARGEARVILNEVNSANPSQLRGYVEVAGKKADVIIANPSGIHCDGCGVINSGRTTLTTGNPKIKDGQVTGFDVEKGQVKVSGKGLDNSRVDYTEIIARETEINAGIWSNKKLTVVTGENRVQRTETAATKNDNDHLIITHTKPSTTPSQQSEKYAVDVSELGGMYAGKIYLIGTEQGLGVRNAGHIGASAGEVHIDSQGRVVNKGTINANHTIQLSSTKGIENQGKIENRQHDIQLTTQADIQQHGSVVARSGNIHQTAKQGIHQQGETVAKGNIHYQAPTVTASTSSLIAAGVEIKDTPNGETRTLEQHSTQGKNLTVSTTGKTTLQGKNLASGKIQVNGQEINLDNSQTSAHTIEAKATQGDIQANNATIVANRDLTLTTPKTLQTQNSTIKAEKITTKQTALNTQNAVWEQTGDSHFMLEAARMDNQGGSIVTQGDFAINTHYLDNTQGKLATNKNLDITTQQGELNTGNGVLFATENITLNTGRLNNENGTILAEKHLQLDTHNQSLNNRQNGQIQALGNMKLSTYEIDNRGGFIQSAGDTTISTALLNNRKINSTGSLLESRNILTLNAQSLLNSNTKNVDTQPTQGIIAGQLNLDTETLDNQQGGIYTENKATLNVKHNLNNHQGEILSWGNLAILGYATDLAIQNSQGIIQAQQDLTIQSKGISEDGHLEATRLSIQQKDDFNTQNDINAGSSLQLSTLGNMTNHHKLSANGVIQLQAQNIDNKVTASISASTTLINAVNNVTNRGLINSYNAQDNAQTIIKAGSQLNNIGTGRIYGDHIALQADRIQNKDETLAGKVSSATIAARQRLDLGAREILNQTDDYNPNKKGGAFIYSGGDIQFGRRLDANHQATGNAAVFRNNSSIVEADKHIALNVDDIENNNIHYRSEIQETGNKTVNKSYIIPTGEAVYNDGNVTAIPTSQLKKFSFSRTWKYAHAYADKDYPVVGKDTKLTGTTALAMPNDISCDSQGHCNLSKAGIYTKDSAVWNYFHITPPAEDMPPLTPEMAAALARIAKTEEYLTDAELDAREQEIAKSGLPTNPTPQERQDYTLLAPYITWTNKYADTYKALSEAIEAQNNRIIGTVYSDFWELNVNREITRENVTQTSLPAQILAGGDITYRTKRFLNDKSAVISGGNLTGELTQLTNRDDVDAIFQTIEQGNRDFTYTKWRGGVKRYFQRKYNSHGELKRIKTEHKDMNIFVLETHKNPQAQPNYVNTKAVNHVTTPQNNVNLTALSAYNDIKVSTRQDGLEVRSIKADTRLPTQSLYRINPQADSHVLIETDPAFTNQKRWLSSDYMYNALRHDHENVHKRLGDGYYEQRLVREQINRLTGRQFLGNYTDFDSQYRGLMDAGITFAQKFNLRPGVSLSQSQVASLTSDIVWLEEETVTLEDGSQQKVLVPKVYAVIKEGDLQANGALISAQNLDLKTQELINQGTIAGRDVALFNANRLSNSGNLSAKIFSANINGDMNNTGNITAENALLLNVTGNLTHQSTLRTDDVNLNGYAYKDTHLDRKGLLHVKGENGTLQIAAGNLTITGADIINDGSGVTYLNAQNALNLTALSTAHSENLGSGDHYRHESQQGIAISRVQGKGDVVLSGASIQSEAAQLEAEKRLALLAENNITLGTATTSANLEEHHRYKSGSLAKTIKTTDLHQAAQTLVGSQLSGEQIQVMAGKNLHATAVQMVADKDLSLSAVENVSLLAGTNHFKDEYRETKKTSGVFTGGGAGITFGSKSEKHAFETEGWTQSDARSAIGSLNGDVSIQAGKHANVLGTDLIAQQDKTLSIQGESLTIEAGKDRIESHESHEYKQSGLTIALSSSLTDMAMSVANTMQRAKQTHNSKLQSLLAIKAAQDISRNLNTAPNTLDTLGNLGNMTQAGENSTAVSQPSVKISVSVGASKSKQESHTTQITHSGSEFTAGHIQLKTTQGDLDIIGSALRATQIALESAKNINLESVQDSYENRTDSKNSGWNVGVFLGMSGNSFGLGVEGSAQVGRGKENTNTVTQSNTYLNGKQVTISSQNNTALRGAVVNAEKLAADIQGDLIIESRQDSNQYSSKQTQAGMSAAVAIYGSGSSASANYAQNNAKLNYAQVEEQSGLKIGDGGMTVNVAGNTHLKGGVVQSTATAEKNQFNTGSLTAENIENRSEVEVKNISAGVSTNMAATAMSLVGGAVSALGNMHESRTATTKSAIGANIQLNTKNSDMSTALSRDVATANEKVKAYDLTAIQENREIASLASQIGATAVGDLAQKMGWEDGSLEKVALHGLVGFISAQLSGGNGVAGATAGMTSEWLNTQVEAYLTQYEQDKTLTIDERKAIQQASAALIGAATGAVIGGDRATAAQGAVTALTAERFNRQLHPEEKQRIKELANGDKEKEARLTAAACALVHCSAQIPNDDPEYTETYAKAKALEDLGNQAEFANERDLLSKQLADYDMFDGISGYRRKLFQYDNYVDRGIDHLNRVDTQYGVTTRAIGASQTAGGAVIVAGSTLGTMGACTGTAGSGCIVAIPAGALGVTYGSDLAASGIKAVYTGKYYSPIGSQALTELTGISQDTADLIYGAPSMVFGVKPLAMGVTKVTGTAANEITRIGGDIKYVAGELGKDLKAGYYSIPNSYKVVFGIEASINATAESIPYFMGKKESSLDNLGGSVSKVLVDSTYATMFSKANSTVGFIADTAKNLSDGKNLENSLTNAATSLGVSKVSGVLIKDDNIKRIINSGSTKLIESVTEEDGGK